MPFLDIFEPETPLRRVANVRQMNRIVNVLMTMEGVGIRIERDNSREGRGWKLVLDEEVSRRITPDGDNEGDILYYDADDEKWKAAGIEPTEGDILYYDSGWKALSPPSLKSVLKHDGEPGIPYWQEVKTSKTYIAVVQEDDTDKIDVYRGDWNDVEARVAERLERNVDWVLRSDFEVTAYQRLLALKISGVWECYMIVDGVSNLTYTNYRSTEWQVLGHNPDGELTWITMGCELDGGE